MANISLNANNLLEAARKIEDAAGKIDNAISRIDTAMSDLETVWNDQNAKQYLVKYDELKNDFPAFKEAVHNYSTFLNAVVEAYRKEFLEPTASSIK